MVFGWRNIMDKKFLKQLKKDSEAFEAMRNEPPFPATDILEELMPLLGEYFEAVFEFNGKEITASFLNGEKIILKAEQV